MINHHRFVVAINFHEKNDKPSPICCIHYFSRKKSTYLCIEDRLYDFLGHLEKVEKKSLLRRSKKPNLLQKLVSVRPNQIWHTWCHIYNNKEYLKGKVSQNLKFRAKMMPYMMLFFEVLTWKSIGYYKGK